MLPIFPGRHGFLSGIENVCMSNKKANITLAVLSMMLVATWVWFFISKKDAVSQVNAAATEQSVAK